MEDKRLQFADKVTLERIQKFHPKYRAVLLEQYLEANFRLAKHIRLRFAQVLRTNKEQNDLYAQGRTVKGKIVTNAKGGESVHNYGLAFDIVILYDLDKNGTFETASWDEKKDFDQNGKADWFEVVNYFKEKGWSWGGDFKSIYDSPHFEVKGYTWRSLKALIDSGQSIKDNNIVYPKI